MTSLATHVSIFLRERLPLENRASQRTCETYALALRLFFEFAAQQLKIRPSSLRLEQLDAPRVQAFLQHLEKQRRNGPATRGCDARAEIHGGPLFVPLRRCCTTRR